MTFHILAVTLDHKKIASKNIKREKLYVIKRLTAITGKKYPLTYILSCWLFVFHFSFQKVLQSSFSFSLFLTTFPSLFSFPPTGFLAMDQGTKK